jgi:predicted RNase H-like HicB family nuclease
MEKLMQEQHIWHATLERLRTSIDPVVFPLWFQETIALFWQEEVFVVGVPTTFAKAYLEVRYLDLIRSALSDVVGSPVRVQLVVSRSLPLSGDLFPAQSDEERHESNTATFLVVIAKETFGYKASVPDVPGCVAVGKTRQEAVQGVHEALQTYLEMRHNDHASVPELQTTAEYICLPLSLDQEQSGNHTLQDTVSMTVSFPRCSFCNKQQDQVVRLTTGPGGFSICNECVDYCREMIEKGTVNFQQLKLALASRKPEAIQ